MSNLIEHAESELRKAGLFDEDSDYGGMVGKAVMDLVRVHSSEGHSGSSHSLTIEVFNRVVNYMTLTPITDSPSEWMEVGKDMMPHGMQTCWQSRRCPSLFSHDGGTTYYDINEKQLRFKKVRKIFGLPIFKMHKSKECGRPQ